MEKKTIEEIVQVDNSEEAINEILKAFIKKQRDKYSNIIDESSNQYQNIKTLSKILYCNNNEDIKIPIIANVPMGQGKSTLLISFLKFMYMNDPNFGAIVVKKTINECHDFCIDLGLKDVEYQKNTIDANILYPDGNPDAHKELMELYYGTGDYGLTHNKDDAEHQDFFIARTVRGFNFEECLKYKDKSSVTWWGLAPSYAVEYDYRLCLDCEMNRCPVKNSKWNFEKHRILAITHARLFLSNDISDMIENLMMFKTDDGKLKRRTVLIVDEKIDTTDIQGITINEFLDLKKVIENSKNDEWIKLFNDVEEYIEKLDYPKDGCNSAVNKQDEKMFEHHEKLEEQELLDFIYKDISNDLNTLKNFTTLRKIVSSKNITTSIKFIPLIKNPKKMPRQISYYKYIDLVEYAKQFNKTVVLDGTAHLDYDIYNSNAVICSDIKTERYPIKVYRPINKCSTSKTEIVKYEKKSKKDHYEYNVTLLAEECMNIIEDNSDKKSLIVVYKSISTIKEYKFKEDIQEELNEMVDKTKYNLIHHGQFTTGVNDFLDYENLIIIGQLDKGHHYYQNKSLALGVEIDKHNTVKLNDYLIANIQQIGRTAMRKGKDVSVYFLCNEKSLVNELSYYFDIEKCDYNNRSYFQEPNKQEKLLMQLKLETEGLEVGRIYSKSNAKKLCMQVGIDPSVLRKGDFKELLKDELKLVNHTNNRYYRKL